MADPPNPAEDSCKLSNKIVLIAAGEAHTLTLTGDGKVYSWGRGPLGRLGTGSDEDCYIPARVTFSGVDDGGEQQRKIVGIAAGAYHGLALGDDGSVWGWGYNIYSQIDDSVVNYSTPHVLEGFFRLASPDSSTHDDENSHKISSIKAGGMMSLAIDSSGLLWIWGNCPHPSETNEGEFSLVITTPPIPVLNFRGRTVVNVACGNEHVVALVTAGEKSGSDGLVCYSWGGNDHGQLGLGDKVSRSNPEVIETFNLDSKSEVYEIACGAYHTAILCKKNDASESVCWTFGLGENGQLGNGTTQSSFSPQLVTGLPPNTFLVSVDCGLFHTSVVSSSGEVWCWGMEKGLGLCPDARFTGVDAGDALSPLLVPRNGLHDHRFQEPVQVVCGAAHTVVVAEAGYKVWSWGRGRSGVLGNGQAMDCYAPTLVYWPLPADDSKKETKPDNGTTNESSEEKKSEEKEEMDKRLSAAMEEMTILQSKLSVMERYASILHGAIFGRPFHENEIPASLATGGGYDVAKEWDDMLEKSDQRKLVRMETFYRDMLAGVKDKLMKKRIQEIVKECLKSSPN